MKTVKFCPVCSGESTSVFLEQENMPVSIGVQWPTREEAKQCKKGDLDLAFCADCGFIWNVSFDADLLEYSQRYDNSLDYSPVFQEFADGLAQRLIDTYEIREKTIVEVGCGKGHFLTLMCERGNNKGIGFDPSYEGERIKSPASERISYFQDFYGEKYTSHRGDLVCCRHVFEHIEDPLEFLKTVRRTIGGNQDTIVYFEVPNVRFILEQLSVWDVIFEHVNYFSNESLAAVFKRSGFEILRLEEAYGGQFLSLEARLSREPEDDGPRVSGLNVSGLEQAVSEFSGHVSALSAEWTKRLDNYASSGRRAVVWGGGAKTVSFLNMLPSESSINYVVDINPNKQGLFVPGSGQEIVAPEFLRELSPEVVILMNPIYREEVQSTLGELGLDAELVSS